MMKYFCDACEKEIISYRNLTLPKELTEKEYYQICEECWSKIGKLLNKFLNKKIQKKEKR